MGNDDNWQRFLQEQKDRQSAEAHRRMEEADRFDITQALGPPTRDERLRLERWNSEVREEVADLERRGCCCDLVVTGGYMTPDMGPQVPFLRVTPKPGCPVPEHEEMLARQVRASTETPTPDPAPTGPGTDFEEGQGERAPRPRGRGRSRIGTWLLLCAVAAIAAMGAAAKYAAPTGSEARPARSPEGTLALQYERINAGDYGGSYRLFAERSKRVVSPRQYRAFFEANAPYSIGDYSVSSVERRAGEATVRAVVLVESAAGEESYPITQQLVREEGEWRVVMRDSQIASFTET